MTVLSKFEERKNISMEIKAKLESVEGKIGRLYAPTSHFYVRKVRAVDPFKRKQQKTPKKEEGESTT
jgi:hypothetical protein